MSNPQIIAICQQLSQEGKTPSVALIKTRLSAPLPMPLLIAGLKQWRSNPDVILEPQIHSESQEDNPQSDADLVVQVASLQGEVRALKDEILQLKSLVQNLCDNTGR